MQVIENNIVRNAISQAFAAAGKPIAWSRVKECETGLQVSYVWNQTIHWGTCAQGLWKNLLLNYQGQFPPPDDYRNIWWGICHEMGHIWQEQHYGRWWYIRSILGGVFRSLPGWWRHDKIPFEIEADKIADATWEKALQLWWCNKRL